MLTGSRSLKERDLARKHIQRTFEKNKQFKVGCHKEGASGVTALKVRELLPMQACQLVKFSCGVNDDELPQEVTEAGVY